ncbi:MAG: DUF1957 domain-containing protein, partial [Candidatus Omnitrophica bacterium]|nr:DUF1957 domain-containing protein [Candidatus Omnitrophota bacterium]
SDWPFIIKTGTMVSYADKRIRTHINRFLRLHSDLINNTINPRWLKGIESLDNIFSDLDCAKYYVKEKIKRRRDSHK